MSMSGEDAARPPLPALPALSANSRPTLARRATLRARRGRPCGITAMSSEIRRVAVIVGAAGVLAAAAGCGGSRAPRRRPGRRRSPPLAPRRPPPPGRPTRPAPRAGASLGVARMYVYQWRANAGDRFDAGLLRPDGSARPGYAALARDVAAQGALRWKATWSTRRAGTAADAPPVPPAPAACRGRVTVSIAGRRAGAQLPHLRAPLALSGAGAAMACDGSGTAPSSSAGRPRRDDEHQLRLGGHDRDHVDRHDRHARRVRAHRRHTSS